MLYLVLVVIVAGASCLILLLYLLLGKGPRVRRAFRRIEMLLDEGNWQEALQHIEALQEETGLTPDSQEQVNRYAANWLADLRSVSGKSHQAATDTALKEKHFEEALKHALKAASYLDNPETEARSRVLDAMLAEVRRLFAAGTGQSETAAVFELLARTSQVGVPSPEVSFWQAMCLIRQNKLEPALNILTQVHEQVGKNTIDPGLYIGGLLHRLGRPQEAIRFLSDANRIDPNCSFVTWQMGVALVASGGDSGLAIRALQRALGPRGFPQWTANPHKAWVESFPEGHSYVRRLASRYPYNCPLWGSDLNIILRQGHLAQAQAYYRQGSFQEAADLYGKLMQDSPPTLVLLRGLGLSLARLGRFDQAFKHLRAALEMDRTDAQTAGYLALCGAMGKPTNADDRPRNIEWAIRLLAGYPNPSTAEWAGIYSAVFAEARSLKMPLSEEHQLQLCQVLASVNATDPPAAAAFSYLASTFPRSVVSRFAWLYCQAATTHNLKSPEDLDLFGQTFRDPNPAREFFTRQKWNFDDVQYTYLERSAKLAPGKFPETLGTEFPSLGEQFLLERSRTEEEAGKKDAALAAVDVLLKLSPRCLPGYDRLACLHYRKGDLEQAVALLNGWHRLDPADHWPLIRQAIIEQQRGNVERRAEVIDQALGLTQGPVRASVAFLGARLALREGVKEWEKSQASPATPRPEGALVSRNGSLDHTLTLLQECLRADPNHTEALWCLAAVRSVLGQKDQLKELAAHMDRPAVKDARFHYLGAVCHLVKQDYPRVLELSQRAAADEALAVESHYLMAWAHLHLKNPTAATQSLQKVAASEKSPSAVHARALLARLGYDRSAYDEAIRWWNQVDAKKRAEWRLDDPLRQTVLLAGLMALDRGQYELAAERFREAGKLGLRDKRLGPLLTLALVKAGEKLLFEQGKK